MQGNIETVLTLGSLIVEVYADFQRRRLNTNF